MAKTKQDYKFGTPFELMTDEQQGQELNKWLSRAQSNREAYEKQEQAFKKIAAKEKADKEAFWQNARETRRQNQINKEEDKALAAHKKATEEAALKAKQDKFNRRSITPNTENMNPVERAEARANAKERYLKGERAYQKNKQDYYDPQYGLSAKEKLDRKVSKLAEHAGVSEKEARNFIKGQGDSAMQNALKAESGLAKKQVERFGTARQTAMNIKESNKALSSVSANKMANSILNEAGEDATNRLIRKTGKQMNKAGAFAVQGAQGATGAAAKKAGAMSKLGKVGKIAAGVGITAAVVSNMNKSKGQQSNAELYGQRTPYGY